MSRPRLTARTWSALLLAALLTGCGTTKMTDSPRAATEMLLVSQAIDYAVAKMDFTPLSGQTVFLDTSPLEKDVVDKGYVISGVRQQLLAHGALLQEERTRATFVVELRAGAIGTDRHSVMVGTPAVSLPSVLPGIPTSIPEIALMKKNDQRGVAKIGVFAYNRVTGRALWQSGTVEGSSQSKDMWVFGTGPFTRGTIRDRTELAGEPLPAIPTPSELLGTKGDKEKAVVPAAGTSKEHLNSSDIGVVQFRRYILDAARVLDNEGLLPAAHSHPELYRLRCGSHVCSDKIPFEDVMVERFGNKLGLATELPPQPTQQVAE